MCFGEEAAGIAHEGKCREESRMTPGFRSDITVLTDTWIPEGYSSSTMCFLYKNLFYYTNNAVVHEQNHIERDIFKISLQTGLILIIELSHV